MNDRTIAQWEMAPVCHFDRLPPEILVEIFRRLPRQSVLPATEVCHRWFQVIAEFGLLDSFPIRLTTEWREHEYRKFEYYLERSERKFRGAAIVIDSERTLQIALKALRKFGHCLHRLDVTIYHRKASKFQMNANQLKELELGLEREDQVLWEQEIDSYSHCMRQIIEIGKETTFYYKKAYRFEVLFMAFVYRRCISLRHFHITHFRRYVGSSPNILLFEGTEMEHLTELEIRGTRFIVLAESPQLSCLSLRSVTAGPSFYNGLHYVFPRVTHLQVIDDGLFDDDCLWTISKRTNLTALTIAFATNTITNKAFNYIHLLKNLKHLVISLDNSDGVLDYCFNPWLRLPIETLEISAHELHTPCILDIMKHNPNLKKFAISTRIPISSRTISYLQEVRPTCRLEFQRIPIPKFSINWNII